MTDDLGGHDPPKYGWEPIPAWRAKPETHADHPDKFEMRILELLCKEGKAHSSVILTCDLYGTTADIQQERTLEWTLVEALLEDLNNKGLVVYRLGEFDIFVEIRPTKLAYKMLHLDSQWIAMTGGMGHQYHPLAERPIRRDDPTDFRSYKWSAEPAGPTTKEDFIEHCVGCKAETTHEHFDKHRVQLIELYGSDDI